MNENISESRKACPSSGVETRWALGVMLGVLCLCHGSVWGQYAGGSGASDDPYLIATAEQMNSIGLDPNNWDKHFKLMADIDLSAYQERLFNTIGTPEVPFTGVFDGNGHGISNFGYYAHSIITLIPCSEVDRYHKGTFEFADELFWLPIPLKLNVTETDGLKRQVAEPSNYR